MHIHLAEYYNLEYVNLQHESKLLTIAAMLVLVQPELLSEKCDISDAVDAFSDAKRDNKRPRPEDDAEADDCVVETSALDDEVNLVPALTLLSANVDTLCRSRSRWCCVSTRMSAPRPWDVGPPPRLSDGGG